MITIEELKKLRESEDKVEFKEAKTQYTYKKERRSVLGYIVALANEGGGKLVFGVKENKSLPHTIVGSSAWEKEEGKLEEDIFRDLKVRVQTEVLFEGENRVLIINVPTRPIGKALKFEDVPLMRLGEDLLPMTDEHLFKILTEQEPDFSATICKGLTIEDLDQQAIDKMKMSYADKQKNGNFPKLSDKQALIDLLLMDENDNLTYASLILLGKREAINKFLPQSKTIWEFRNHPTQIYFDNKVVIAEPLFKALDEIWKLINQPTLNKKHPIQTDTYIFDLYDFNEEVIREALLNAVAHRDYTISSEVVVKQYPNQITISNPGGFPKGVTIENLLTVNSTPRCRLMTEILEKTGLVERSGQGVDKIYSLTLSEGKSEPDYSASNMFQVSLNFKTEIVDQPFHIYINTYIKSGKEPKLGVEQIITLYKIRNGNFRNLNPQMVEQLESAELIKKTSSSSLKYILNDNFYSLEKQSKQIGKRYIKSEITSLLLKIQNTEMKIGDLEEKMSDQLNRNQIKYLLNKMKEDHIIDTSGMGRGTKYFLAEEFKNLSGDILVHAVLKNLHEKYDENFQ